jgi:hypothetical protein
VDLIERRVITHLAVNEAGIIHDYELALVGGTSANVARSTKQGQFGLWTETARLNEIINDAAARQDGEAVRRTIVELALAHRDLSLAPAGWRLGVPVNCHVAIGNDILHAMSNCSGAAIKQTACTDFARAIQGLEGACT